MCYDLLHLNKRNQYQTKSEILMFKKGLFILLKTQISLRVFEGKILPLIFYLKYHSQKTLVS